MGRRWRTVRRGASVRGGAVRVPPAPNTKQQGPWTCALCGRQARGFRYSHRLEWDCFPTYRFCSIKCCDAGGVLAQRSNGMIDTTLMEKQAIKDARRAFAVVLTDLGLLASFEGCTAADIDRLIKACLDGFRASVLRQASVCDRL